MNTLIRSLGALSLFALLLSCHLTKEEGDVFSFPSLADSLAGADHATILLKDENGRVIDTLFHGPVDSTTRFRKLDAPHYDGGIVVISIEGRQDGVVIFREDRSYSGKDGKVLSSHPTVLPGSSLKVTAIAPRLTAGDSVPLPSIEILPAKLAGSAVQWISRNPNSFTTSKTHLRAHAEGAGFLVAKLESDTAKRDSLWVEVAQPIGPHPELDSLILYPDTLVLTVRGPIGRFAVRFKPDTALPDLDWRVEDSSFASVASGGSLSSKAPGQTRVIATSRTRPLRSDTATLRILPAVKVDSVRFALESLNLFAQGAAESLAVTVYPKGANPEVSLTVADPALASLEGRRIRGIKDGETRIFARSLEDPTQWDSLRVLVRPLDRVQRVTVQPGSLTLFFKGEPGQLAATLTPASLSPRFLWRSTTSAVAVDGNGKVTPMSPGAGFIVVMAAADTVQRDSALITVKKDVPILSVGRDTVIAVGRTVSFPLSVVQEYGTVVMLKWDLDGNGVYEDSSTSLRTNLSQTYSEAREHLARFYVRDSEGNDAVATRKITAVNGPVIQFHSPSTGAFVNKSPVEVTWSVDGIRQTGSEPLVEGANAITRSAKDAAGNTYSATLTVHLDTQVPVVAISQPLANTLTRQTHLPVAWTVDGRPQTNRVTESLGGRQGSISIIRDWTDSAGNRGADTVLITRDTVAPAAVAFVNPSSPAVVNVSHAAPVQWAWTRTGEPADSFLVSLNGAPAMRQAGTSYILPLASNQTYVLQVQQIDAAGNVSPSASHSVTVDKSPPPAPVVSGTTPTSSPTWNWSAGAGSDGARVFRYKLSTATAYSAEGAVTSFSPTGLGSGGYTLLVQERDAAGNWSADGTHAIMVDRSGPTLGISSPSDMGRVTNFNPMVTGTVIDANGVNRVEYRINASNYVVASKTGENWNFGGSYVVGQNNVWLRAEDSFGNRDSLLLRIFKYPNVVFVRKGASGTGKSWEDALGELHSALNPNSTFASGTEIWVTKGTYRNVPSIGGNMSILWSNIKVVGGFSDVTPAVDSTQRDFSLGATSIGNRIYVGGESTIVNSVLIDGFTIIAATTGYTGVEAHSSAEGLVIKNIKVNGLNDDDGALILRASSARLENCSLEDNKWADGVGIHLESGAKMINCTMKGNTTSGFSAPIEFTGTLTVEGGLYESNYGDGGNGPVLSHFYVTESRFLWINKARIQGGVGSIHRDSPPSGQLYYGTDNIDF